MTFQVRVNSSDIVFDCDSNQNILDAALKAGYELSFSCLKGVCGSCKAKVISGDVTASFGEGTLTAEELENGFSLLCQARPCSNVGLEVASIKKFDPNAIKRIKAKLQKIERLTEDVSILNLRFPAGIKVPFKPGQYLRVVLSCGETRCYSMANPGTQKDAVQLHVRHVPGGVFSNYLEISAAVGDILDIELPVGDFYLRPSSKPLIFLASGTGFAPIKSIFESMVKAGAPERSVYLYWGGRRKVDLYMYDLARTWERTVENFKFVPVLSDEDNGNDRTGFVHQAVLSDFDSLSDYEVYACGAPAMIAAARTDFLSHRALPTEHFYCDAFVTSYA